MISPYLLSNSDVDGKNGAPGGGLFNDYSAGVQIATSWKIDDLPGHFSPIFGYTDKNAADLDNSHLLLDILEGISVTTKNDNWVAGFTFDQYIYVPSASKAASIPTADFAEEPEGIGVFMRFHYAPENRNPWNIALSGGLGGRGVIPGRPNDRYGLGFFALLESDDVEDNINEIVNLDDEWGMRSITASRSRRGSRSARVCNTSIRARRPTAMSLSCLRGRRSISNGYSLSNFENWGQRSMKKRLHSLVVGRREGRSREPLRRAEFTRRPHQGLRGRVDHAVVRFVLQR